MCPLKKKERKKKSERKLTSCSEKKIRRGTRGVEGEQEDIETTEYSVCSSDGYRRGLMKDEQRSEGIERRYRGCTSAVGRDECRLLRGVIWVT